MSDKEIMASHKTELEQKNSEETKPGLVFSPAVDIYETAEQLTVVADLPGVDVSSVDIDLEDDDLTISADAGPRMVAGRRALLTEYESGRYHRKFRVGKIIDRENISATMKNGVLELVLPKIGPAKPRKIEVSAV